MYLLKGKKVASDLAQQLRNAVCPTQVFYRKVHLWILFLEDNVLSDPNNHMSHLTTEYSLNSGHWLSRILCSDLLFKYILMILQFSIQLYIYFCIISILCSEKLYAILLSPSLIQ